MEHTKKEKESDTALFWHTDLNPDEILWFKIVGRAATPVNDVFVLTFTTQLAVPVGDSQIIVHQGVAHVTVPEHRVEEGLGRKHKINTGFLQNTKRIKLLLFNCKSPA